MAIAMTARDLHGRRSDSCERFHPSVKIPQPSLDAFVGLALDGPMSRQKLQYSWSGTVLAAGSSRSLSEEVARRLFGGPAHRVLSEIHRGRDRPRYTGSQNVLAAYGSGADAAWLLGGG